MTVRVNKDSFNLREKLLELERPIGLKGSELMKSDTMQEARDFVSAGRKNLIINGDMRVAQRGTSATNIGSAFACHTVDKLKMRNNGGTTARYTNTQSTDSVESEGFRHSFKLVVTTAKGTLTSNHYQGVATRIEGLNLQHLCFGTSNAKNLTLSFWVKSNTTGQYSCHFSNWDNSKNISRPYTINTSNTWEKKTITIPGDTTTVIPNHVAIGLEIGWCLATTSYYNDGTDGGVWHATSDSGKRHSGQVVEFGGTEGDTWYLAGVQLEVGKNATEFEHRPYGEELALCQRYYWRVPNARWLNGYKRHDNSVYYQLDTPVPMRVTPTPTIHSVGVFTNHQSAFGGAVQTTCSVFEYRPDSGRGTLQIESTYSANHTFIPSWEAGTIDFNAEI